MTDREAIEILSRVVKGAPNALDRAISALREREERNKGCKYCLEYADLPEHFKDGKPIGKVFDTSISQDKNGWHIEMTYDSDIGIRYCPICGRPLEQDTKMELQI